MDQLGRYADLSLSENDLILYTMTPADGYGYLEVVAHFAAESSTGTNVEVCTTDDFTNGCGRYRLFH